MNTARKDKKALRRRDGTGQRIQGLFFRCPIGLRRVHGALP